MTKSIGHLYYLDKLNHVSMHGQSQWAGARSRSRKDLGANASYIEVEATAPHRTINARRSQFYFKLPHIGPHPNHALLPVMKRRYDLQAERVLGALLLVSLSSTASNAAGSIPNRIRPGLGGVSDALGHTADSICETLFDGCQRRLL